MDPIRRHFLGAVMALSSLCPAQIFADSSEASVFTDSAFTNNAFARSLENDQDPAYCNRWAIGFDNDFLVPGGRDQDYTYGLSLLHTGTDLADRVYFGPLNLIDRRLGLNGSNRQAVEFGLYGFTPEDITQSDANPEDRPYASLVYAATRQERVYPLNRTVVTSQLTVGVLGLNVVGDLQKGFHSFIEGDSPQGWQHQVSEGGEPTFRYSLARQQLLGAPTGQLEVKHTQSVSVGYITEASWGLNFRTGHLNSAWHNFHPEQASYAETSAQLNNRTTERFFWAGFAIKARAYNAFLQGQWRDSALEYSSSGLRHLILEAWIGYTHGFTNGMFVSYGLRGHTSEIRDGTGDRNVLWGGLMLGRNLE